MMPRQESADLISVGARAIVDSANRLGLTWRLRVGTVVETGANPTVVLDGDEQPIGVVPMSGNPAADSRVYVITVPPSGNFIVGQVAWWETDTELVTFVTQTSVTQAVTFDRPFLVAPHVFTNIDSAAAATAQWHSRASSITTTGFTLFLFRGQGAAANSWTNVPVSWLAMAQ